MKRRPTNRWPHHGHTLIELVTAMVAASMLLAGLASTIYIGRQVALTPAISQKVLDNTNMLFGLTEELRYALHIVDRSPTMIEFVVDDRNGDGVEETIRYAWSGAVGDSLERTFNDGAPVSIVESVESFTLEYTIDEATEEIETLVESGEVVLWQQAAASGGDEYIVKDGKWCGQHLPPLAQNIYLPTNMASWKLTKMQFVAKEGGKDRGQFAVQLRNADSSGKPTSDILGQVVVDETELTAGFVWYEKVFSPAISNLSPHTDFAVVHQWLSDREAANFRINLGGGSGLLTTDDSGASWTHSSPGEMSFAILGTHTTPGTPITLNRKWITRIDISLQEGTHSVSRVQTSVHLDNRPEILTDYVRADFDADPTRHDVDGDGTPDWKVDGGGAFDVNSLSDGVWTAEGVIYVDLETNETDNVRFGGRWRGTSHGTWGPYMDFFFPLNSSTWGYTGVTLNYQANGTQTATIHDLMNGSYVPIFVIPDLASDMLEIEMTVSISARRTRVVIDGVDYGVFSFIEHSGTLANATLKVGLDDAVGEFDSVMAAVSEETP